MRWGLQRTADDPAGVYVVVAVQLGIVNFVIARQAQHALEITPLLPLHHLHRVGRVIFEQGNAMDGSTGSYGYERVGPSSGRPHSALAVLHPVECKPYAHCFQKSPLSFTLHKSAGS